MVNFERKQIIFIVNPISGNGKKNGIEDSISRNIDSNEFELHFAKSNSRGDASKITREALTKGVKYFVAIGGDGTVNEVARELINTDAALGIIPKGSGNGMARHLGIPLSVRRAVQVINTKNVVTVDFGTLNGTPFFCTAGIGFDAHVGDMFSRIGGRGFSNYIRTTIVEYIHYKPEVYTIKVNGQINQKEAFLITIANASQWGNNAFIAPQANMQDGLLDVTVVSPFPKYLSPSFGLKLFSKRIGTSRYVETFKMKEVEIERGQSGCVHFDGEPTTMGEKLSIQIHPKGLNVFVP